jgi:hypothetical protein
LTVRTLAIAAALGACLTLFQTDRAAAGSGNGCDEMRSSFHGVIILDGLRVR